MGGTLCFTQEGTESDSGPLMFGIAMLATATLSGIIGYWIGVRDLFFLMLPPLIVIIPAIILIAAAMWSMRVRTVIIDSTGVHLVAGKSAEWDVPWKELLKLQAVPRSIGNPRLRLRIHAKGDTYSLEEPAFGQETLRVMFRKIASRASSKELVLDDPLGWALDVPHAPPEQAYRPYERAWHKARTPGWGMITLVLALLSALFGPLIVLGGRLLSDGMPVGLLMMVLFSAILLPFYAIPAYYLPRSPTALWFDDEGVVVALGFWRKIHVPVRWTEMAGCAFDDYTENLVILTPRFKFLGFQMARPVTEAVCARYAESASKSDRK